MAMITLTGPTATGKTRLAALLANHLGGEIISADSRQVFRGMDLGTGKDHSDYLVNGRQVPCHLTDIREAGETYSVYEFVKDFHRVCKEIQTKGKTVILCGGTGMYIESVLEGYQLREAPEDPALRAALETESMESLQERLKALRPLHNTTDLHSRERLMRAIEIAMSKGGSTFPPVESLLLGLQMDRAAHRERITLRLESRISQGMIEEVETLLQKGIPPETLDFYGLEYRYISRYLTGRYTFDDMKTLLNTAIHQFAKRQATWFRRMERKGFRIHWLDAAADEVTLFSQAMQILDHHKELWK